MECTVSYDSWQMECCGTTFFPGCSVKWLVEKRVPKNIPPEIEDIDYRYEAHSGDWEKLFLLEGKVESIHLLYQSPISSDTKKWMLIQTDAAVGFEQDFRGMECQNYIVKLVDCSIRPAVEEDLFNNDDALDDESFDGELEQTAEWNPFTY